jgi:hypothetical protein
MGAGTDEHECKDLRIGTSCDIMQLMLTIRTHGEGCVSWSV